MVKELRAVKGGDFQWVQFPRGDECFQPVATGAAEEVSLDSFRRRRPPKIAGSGPS
jgi:hypothetical protein